MVLVSDLELAELDMGSGELAGDGYHRVLAGLTGMAGLANGGEQAGQG
jgi:hypothetical protein